MCNKKLIGERREGVRLRRNYWFPRFLFSQIESVDSLLYPENQTGAGDNKQSAEVFPKGSSIPSVEIFTFLGSNTFTLDVQYADPAELQAPAKISSYTIGHFQAENNKRALMNVKTRLDIHGIVSVVSATNQLLEEYETDVVPEPNQMGIVAKVETSDKKAMKRILPLFEDDVYRGLTHADLEKAVKEELTMLEMLETKHKKCVLEAYVSETLEKFQDANTNCEFFADHEREKLVEILNDAKDWLCEDGKDKTKRDYIVKLKNLKKTCNPILTRYTEHTKRECVISKLSDDINNYKVAAESTTDPKFVHIDLAEKQNVLKECEEVEAWLKEKKQQQDELPKHATPILSSCDVKERAEALATFYMSVMMKPKPTEKPATAPVPPSLATTVGGEQESEGPHNNYEVDENSKILFSKISGVEDPVTFWKGTSKLLVYIQENKDTYLNSQSCPFYEKYMEVLDCLAHNDEGSATCLSYCAEEELIEAVGNKIYNMQDHDYIILVVAGLLCIRHGFFDMGIFFFKNIKDLESSSNLLKHNVLKCSSDMPPKLVSLCTDEIERWIVELLRFWSFWMFGVNASDAKIVDEVTLEREKTYFSGLAKSDGLEKEYSIHKKSVMYNIKKYEFFNLIILIKKHGLKIESGRRHAFKPTIKDRDIVTTKLKSLKAELSKLTTSDLGVYGFLISFTSGALFHLFRYNDDAKESLKKAKEVIEEQLNPFKRFFLQNNLNNLDSHFQNQIKSYTEEELDELNKEPKQTKLTKQAKKAQKAKPKNKQSEKNATATEEITKKDETPPENVETHNRVPETTNTQRYLLEEGTFYYLSQKTY